MAAKEQFVELHTNNFKGLVLSPSLVDKEFNAATVCANFVKTDSGRGTIRPASKCIYRRYDTSDDIQVLFPFTYTYYDAATGATNEELLALGMSLDSSYVQQETKLYKLEDATLTISYSGTGSGRIVVAPADLSNGGSENVWRVSAYANDVLVYGPTSYNTANITLTQDADDFDAFITNIHALANFTCSPSSLSGIDGYTPIDFFASGYDVTIANGGSTTITYKVLTEIGEGTDAPLKYTDANFILPSALNYSNVMYFAYGTYEHKYDGQDFYRSGLPQATINAIADSAGGTTHALGNIYIYKLVYSRKDAKGNVIDGEDSDDTLAVATHTMVATRDIDLTVNNLTASSYPDHALKGAKVNGAQAGVTTITVDAGHTLEIGDTAYFYDGVSSSYVEREITGTAATTITIAGANVNVADNIFISNNVRIQIWRTKDDGVDFYFVDEIPNDPSSATQVYLDDVPDSSLTELFTEQLRKHSEPPKCSYVGEHQGLKVLSGDPDNPNRVYWALPNDIEAYPLESNNTEIRGGGLGPVTGFGTVDGDVLAIFKAQGHLLLDGSLDDLNFSIKDRANTGIGCTSFRSLAYLGEASALTGVSLQGVFIFNGQVPTLAIGENITPLFKANQTQQVNGTAVPNTSWQSYATGTADVTIERVLKRASAINDTINNKYHLYIPAEIGVPGEQKVVHAPASKYLVYDYDPEHLFWTEYAFYNRYREATNPVTGSGIPIQGLGNNAWAGFTIFNNEVVFGNITYEAAGNTTAHIMTYQTAEADDTYSYIEAAHTVQLLLHYVPITREAGAVTSFFSPLHILVHKFIDDIYDDPIIAPDFGSDFYLRVRGVSNLRHYRNAVRSTYARRTFKVSDGRTALSVKCVKEKVRAYQIHLSSQQDTLPDPSAYIRPIFDDVTFVYSTPYDKKQKDPKAQNG